MAVSAGAIKAGEAYVRLSANDAALRAGLDSAQTRFKLWGNVLKGMAIGIGVGISGAILGALSNITGGLERIDKLSKSSRRIGVPLEELSGGLAHAANLSGVSMEQLEGALIKLRKNLADAAEGAKEPNAALQALGLTVAQLSGQTLIQQFGAIADALNGIDDDSKRVQVTLALFGKSGAALSGIFEEGSAGLQRMQADAERLGKVVSTKTGKDIEAANDEWTRMLTSLESIGNSLAIVIGGPLRLFANIVEKIATAFKNIVEFAGMIGERLGKLVGIDPGVKLSDKLTGGELFKGLAAELRNAKNPAKAVADEAERMALQAEKAAEAMAKWKQQQREAAAAAVGGEEALRMVEEMNDALDLARLGGNEFEQKLQKLEKAGQINAQAAQFLRDNRAQLDANAKAAEDWKGMLEEAARLAEEAKDPFELLADEMERLAAFFQMGLIDQNQLDRMEALARNRLLPDMGSKGGGVAGTFDTHMIQQAFGFGPGSVDREQLEAQKKMEEHLKRIAAAAAGGVAFWTN